MNLKPAQHDFEQRPSDPGRVLNDERLVRDEAERIQHPPRNIRLH